MKTFKSIGRLCALVALLVCVPLTINAGAKMLVGFDQADNTRLSIGTGINLGGPFWAFGELDIDTKDGEKQIEPSIAYLFSLNLPVRVRVGPILGPSFEYSGQFTPGNEPLWWTKVATGGILTIANNSGTIGIAAFYKAAIKLDNSDFTPTKPTWGARVFFDISLLTASDGGP